MLPTCQDKHGELSELHLELKQALTASEAVGVERRVDILSASRSLSTVEVRGEEHPTLREGSGRGAVHAELGWRNTGI